MAIGQILKLYIASFRELGDRFGARASLVSKFSTISILCLSAMAHAQVQAPEAPRYRCTPTNFRNAAIAAFDRAIKNGWEKAGNLDLKEMRSAIRTSPVEVVCTDAKVNITDGRWSGRFTNKEGARKIEVRPDNFDEAPGDLQEGFSVHEYFGALGRHDLNYEHSLRIIEMGKRKFAPESPLAKPATSLRSGGSTVVGGGGDIYDLHIRHQILRALLEALETTSFTAEGKARSEKIVSLFLAFDLVFSVDPIKIVNSPKLVLVTMRDSRVENDMIVGVEVGRAWLHERGEEGVGLVAAKVFEALILQVKLIEQGHVSDVKPIN